MAWWELDSILKFQSELKQFYDAQEPIACPNCGDPLLPGPPQALVTKYCRWGHFNYPQDYDVSTMSGM